MTKQYYLKELEKLLNKHQDMSVVSKLLGYKDHKGFGAWLSRRKLKLKITKKYKIVKREDG